MKLYIDTSLPKPNHLYLRVKYWLHHVLPSSIALLGMI